MGVHDGPEYAASEPDVRERLVAIEELWQQLVSAAEEGQTEIQSAQILIELTDGLVTESNQLVERIISKLEDRHGKLLAESGRQRMLGQRVASLALCKKAGVSEGLVEGKVDDLLRDLEESNRELKAEVGDETALQSELDTAYRKIEELGGVVRGDEWNPYRLLETKDHFVEGMNRTADKVTRAATSDR